MYVTWTRPGNPFVNVQWQGYYWSGTDVVVTLGYYDLFMLDGQTGSRNPYNGAVGWPVRSAD
jgi:hypothetical protein